MNACRAIIPTPADPTAGISRRPRAYARGCASAGLPDAHRGRGRHPQFRAGGVRARERRIGDIVGIARQALADPDWFLKVKSGQGDAVRLCKYTNYCEALDQRHREVTCELWDRDGLDQAGVARSADGKRRLVAPDWPAR